MGSSLAAEFSKVVSNRSQEEPPHIFITGGETTVSLSSTPPPGRGGRNLELALSSVKILAGLPDVFLITLATDGEDGVTDAAGAVVTSKTFQRAMDLNLDPDKFLDRHDSYNFFEPLGDLIKIGSTHTNVNDLCFLFIM